MLTTRPMRHFQIDDLKRKNVVYTKADKGNLIVILDKEHYKQKLEELLENEQYLKILKKFIIQMQDQFPQYLKKYETNSRKVIYLSKIGNQTLPRIYDLPKIEKPELTMRPMIFPNLQMQDGSHKIQLISEIGILSIKNSQDLVDIINNMNLNSEDRLVSFNVKALFPRIPVNKLMTYLAKWLNCLAFKKKRLKIMSN